MTEWGKLNEAFFNFIQLFNQEERECVVRMIEQLPDSPQGRILVKELINYVCNPIRRQINKMFVMVIAVWFLSMLVLFLLVLFVFVYLIPSL